MTAANEKAGKNRKILICLCLIFLAGFLAYLNSFANDFVWDDKFLIGKNEHIKSFADIPKIFSEDLFYMLEAPTGYYRPIQSLTYMFDYFLWGNAPFGYHLTNFLLQFLNSILVFYLILLVTKDEWKSCFVAAVFLVHPAFIPIVSYVSGRADLLGFFFSLLSIAGAIKYLEGAKAFTLLLVPFGYILAILSKEYYIFSPLLVVFYIFAFGPGPRIDGKFKLSLFSCLFIAIIYSLIRSASFNYNVMGGMANISFFDRLAVFPYIISNYVIVALFPVSLHMEKKLIYTSLFEFRFIAAYIVPLVIIYMLYHFRKTGQKDKLFFLGWFAVCILPLSNLFIPLKVFSADHWVYMASIGLFAFLTLEFGRIKRFFGSFVKSSILISIVIIVVLICVTAWQNRYWKNDEIFFSRLLKTSPHFSRVLLNAGNMYEEKGEHEKALDMYTRAIQEAKEPSQYYFARGTLYMKMRDMDKARDDMEKAVEMAPSVAMYHNNLGGIYAELGMVDKARVEWEAALKIDPDDKLARENLMLLGQ